MSTVPKLIDHATHQAQIQAYAAIRPRYETYARVLGRVLEQARAAAVPEAVIQSRAKTLSSFAEKCARRVERYPDAVNQFTDLCGARVIVQTLAQVQAVCHFIDDNFKVIERDDKSSLLAENAFGYRDMHFIIRLPPERAADLGISGAELTEIGDHCAEIQVRTWLQHAWADALHDRIYKSSIHPSRAMRRSGNLLAALLEEGDRNVDQMAEELDGMIANYSAFVPRIDVEREIAIQRLIRDNEPDAAKKPRLAVGLARLLESRGDFSEVQNLLEPDRETEDAHRVERLLSLGFARCKQHSNSPTHPEFVQGRTELEIAEGICSRSDPAFVSDRRKASALQARARSRLGWAYAQEPGREPDAATCFQQACECEPHNPYYLADMLGFEIYRTRQHELPITMKTTLLAARECCRSHAEAGIELPRAYFTSGRLALLLGQSHAALGDYARGIHQFLQGEQTFPQDQLDEEANWLRRLHFGRHIPSDSQVVLDLLQLAQEVSAREKTGPEPRPLAVLIVAGGAASMTEDGLKQARPLLAEALGTFSGKLISGGTRTGIPGLVGDIAAGLKKQSTKQFDLFGYIPQHLPQDGPKHDGYDRFIVHGDHFSPEQILRCWQDLLDEGIHPEQVAVVGFGGGPLSAVEYRVALTLGARVAVLPESGGAAAAILQDPLWSGLPALLPLIADRASVWAFVASPKQTFKEPVIEDMAQEIHGRYRASNTKDLPDNMQPWDNLKDTYKRANREQARFAIQILEACDFGIRDVEAPGEPKIFREFTAAEIECMAELEHGRWNTDRLRDGWRLGPRDDDRKLHNCLVPWDQLSDDIKQYDRDAVINFPALLAKAGLEVYRQ